MAESNDETPALAYIEKTLADSYRREIDQEENIWRSLPFFAATLALQMATLFQMIDKFPGLVSPVGWAAASLLVTALLLDVVSLGFLGASIYPQLPANTPRALITTARSTSGANDNDR